MVGEQRNYQILVNLAVADVPVCTSSIAKTRGLKHLQLPNVISSSGHPDGASVIHRRTSELPVEQNTVTDGEFPNVHAPDVIRTRSSKKTVTARLPESKAVTLETNIFFFQLEIN